MSFSRFQLDLCQEDDFCNVYEVDLSIVSVLLFQLELCQEEDFYKVYEVDLHGTDITHIPDLEKVRDSQNAQTQEGTCAYTHACMHVHMHACTHTHTHLSLIHI